MESPRSRAVIIATALLATAAVVPAQVSQEPVAIEVDAGPDQVIEQGIASVVLTGSFVPPRATAVDGDFTFQWTQLGGPPVQIFGADTLNPTVFPIAMGTARLELRVDHPVLGAGRDVVRLSVLDERDPNGPAGELSGDLRKWHKLSLTFKHREILFEGGTPNPFTDLRLQVRFEHLETGRLYDVPGFFAADGDAANTSAFSGDRYRANFTPDAAGVWRYETDFREGPQVAVDANPGAGSPTSFHGLVGYLYVQPADPGAPGFLSKGRLEYVNKHHLRFAETGEYFLKNGAGSPENFFGYYEFDNTIDQGGNTSGLTTAGAMDGLHHYDAHLSDYRDLGVPPWAGDKGKRIYGAISYLASRGVNSLYALTFNIDGGDGQEVWPWWAVNTKFRFDVSKLAQWELVLDHMNRAGIVWHVFTQEIENDHTLDGGLLGTQRKLYYRELIARLGHAPGLVWNLGEENRNTSDARKEFAEYIRAVDPYDHPIALHNQVQSLFSTFGPLLGTHLELATLQGSLDIIPADARQLIADSAAAGRPWVVSFSEQNPANDGVVPDSVDFWHDDVRRKALWPMLLGQGGGCEWYFGYDHPNSDLDCEDFRSRDNLWQIVSRGIEFVRRNAPFQDMVHADGLAFAASPEVLAAPGRVYLVYLPFGGPLSLDLTGHPGFFSVRWFDARNGGALQLGSINQVNGDAFVALGTPPGPGDWVALVRSNSTLAPQIDTITFEPSTYTPGVDFAMQVRMNGLEGTGNRPTLRMWLRDPDGNPVSSQTLQYRGGNLYSLFLRNAPAIQKGTWKVVVAALGHDGERDIRVRDFVVE